MTSTLTFTMDLTAKTGRFTDTTDYDALGFDVSLAQAKGLGTIYAQGEAIIELNTVGSPMIDLQSWATYYEFDLELDSNGDVANITYSIDYSVRFAPTNLQFLSSGVITTLIGDGSPEYADFLEAGDVLTFDGSPDVNRTISTVNALVSGNPSYTLTASIDLTSYDAYSFDVTHETFSDSWTFSGCTQLTPAVALTADCDYGDYGTWSVTNTTPFTTQTLVELEATINYPSWTGEDPIVVDELPYTNNRLATGTYSVTLVQTISQVEASGLILTYEVTVTTEFQISCNGSLCSILPCYENLRVVHAAALRSSKVSPYQESFDNATAYMAEYTYYKGCGMTTEAATAFAALAATLDSCGCDCSSCDENQYIWVQNTSASTITAITVLQAQVATLQLSTTLFNSLLPIATSLLYLPNTVLVSQFRPLVDVSEITIAKEYFEAEPNGYGKQIVEIEMHVWIGGDITWTPTLVNTETDDNILPSITGITGEDSLVRVLIKLGTWMVSGTVAQLVSFEATAIDNANSAYNLNANVEMNIATDLWDLTEDLVLDFSPSFVNTAGITYLKITAITTP